jgi:hypothetical protein
VVVERHIFAFIVCSCGLFFAFFVGVEKQPIVLEKTHRLAQQNIVFYVFASLQRYFAVDEAIPFL